MKEIHFIRHAQSLGNLGLRTKNISSIDLSEYGYQQAKDLIHQIPYTPELIIHSTYIRTKLTAQPIIQHHNITNVQEWDDLKELSYLDPLKWDNSTHDERQPAIDNFWNRCDPYHKDGEAESFNQTLQRVKNTIDRLDKLSEKKILVFTHGQFLQIMRLYLMLGDNPKEIMSRFREEDRKHPIQNAGIYTYDRLINL
jgi:broad specificity phosphatase PhoE